MFTAIIVYDNEQKEKDIYDTIDKAKLDVRDKHIFIEHGCDCSYCEEGEYVYPKSVKLFDQSSTQIEFRWKNKTWPPGKVLVERKHGDKWVEDFGGISSEGDIPTKYRRFVDGKPLENVVAEYKERDEKWWDNETEGWW